MMQTHRHNALLWAVLLAVGLSAGWAHAEPKRFAEKQIAGARLVYVNEVPVLSLQGSPNEIGSQLAALVGPATRKLVEYPKQTFARGGDNETWSQLLKASRALWPNIPARHREEMDTLVRLARVDRDSLLAGNVMMDIYRGVSCSSLMVEPSRSATGGLLFGRNLDFFSNGYLHQYTLVTVYRPKDRHAFASVGFAGLFGCLSGMNDAGLAVAVHEVLVSRDGSRLFNPEGVPYVFAFRRILEECTTVDEAEQLLKSMKRTTMYNLAVCDEQQAIVLEATPKNVARREAINGLCACTNHFRSPELAVFPFCGRFNTLTLGSIKRYSVDDVTGRMHAASMRRLTLQTMVFEPAALRLHLAFGNLPASAGPFHQLDLKPWFQADSAEHKSLATTH
ncbi:MAG: hypothetical protein JW888_18650 [Pirellulales bacterium]|nr:hypothetical protein [Pirellulales bacterium]